ncbi:hypothetical protein [Rhizobium halophytocola]|uniref:Uncharacterized protein n=1 Tax=Rhizobium halophytocola TaxID=735519 RepID=A0ABS4DSX8_9HYPH|nr:hypothetical protein [Rhizobium halophytocola]MBP1848802.1 hypothetical protein [Rhizobium halophytocola]
MAPLLLGSEPAYSDGFSDPDWPCIQRRVDQLSPALMWPQPVSKISLPQAAQDLAAQLSLRRVGLDQAATLVADFATANPKADPDLFGTIFYTVFDQISERRQRVIRGIVRYAQNQTAMAERIKVNQDKMEAMTAAKSKDFDGMDKLEQQIDWDERIYHDRSKALTYVCETPVILEKRAYAIAKLLQQRVTN